MTRSTHKDLRTIKRLTGFLDEFVPESYQIKYNKDGSMTIEMDSKTALYLKSIDHDCKASPEDGCGGCEILGDLNLIPDFDDVWKD